MRRLVHRLRVPLIVPVVAALGALMWVPAIHASLSGAHEMARVFFYHGLMVLVLAAGLGLATFRRAGVRPPEPLRLLAVLCAVMPPLAAWPVWAALPVPFHLAWVDAVSALTTTGAPVPGVSGISREIDLWRGLVAWAGGMGWLIAAAALLAPRNLGGFEILSWFSPGERVGWGSAGMGDDTTQRLARVTGAVAPGYALATLVLWFALTVSGEGALDALMRAMATLSTSGILPADAGAPGILGEMAVALLLLPALSRRLLSTELAPHLPGPLYRDAELRMAAALVLAVTVAILARHWIYGGGGAPAGAGQLVHSIWGAFFTALSFLTTAGFVSDYWSGSQSWAGLTSPELLLAGLALVGGGVATTAGGVKLMRVVALLAHGRREIEGMLYPDMVAGRGALARRVRREGAQAAWVFFMLFAIGQGAVVVCLTFLDVPMIPALIQAIAALANTGPLVTVAGFTLPGAEAPLAGAVLAVAMLVGRLEVLVAVAMLNPDLWRW